MSDQPTCRCGKVMTPENATIEPALFLCDECINTDPADSILLVIREAAKTRRELSSRAEDGEYKRLVAENTALRAAILNAAGDDLCWFQHEDKGKIPPREEFLESCRRYHAQMSGERGELTGCKTIAQLEQALARAIDERDKNVMWRQEAVALTNRVARERDAIRLCFSEASDQARKFGYDNDRLKWLQDAIFKVDPRWQLFTLEQGPFMDRPEVVVTIFDGHTTRSFRGETLAAAIDATRAATADGGQS